MITAKMKDEALGFVGEITEIHPEIIFDVLDKGYIPVVSTVACDKEGNSYNVNADTAAAKIAGALGAECLISMTDITGIMRDKDNADSLISTLYVSDTQELVTEGVISGGMIPKVECCTEAIRRGVKKVFVIDGRVPHSLLIETLTDEGMGTMLVSGDGVSEEE
jgi:acetylglutamate kinase